MATIAAACGPPISRAVDLTEDHGGLGRGVLGEVVAGQFTAGRLVHHTDRGVAHLTEGEARGIGVVDGHSEDDLLALGGNRGEVDDDLLVVAFPTADEVVAQVHDGPFW
jgi:hypothetical protein